jgi:hypothetical protein
LVVSIFALLSFAAAADTTTIDWPVGDEGEGLTPDSVAAAFPMCARKV